MTTIIDQENSKVGGFLIISSLQFILIVTITCSTDLDDSPDIHTTCLACCVVVCVSSLVQPACLLEHGAHGKRSGRHLLFVEVFLQEWAEYLSELERLHT